ECRPRVRAVEDGAADRSTIGDGARPGLARRADDAGLAPAPRCPRVGPGRPAVHLPGAAARRHRGGARGVQRGRDGRPGARDPGRAVGRQRDHAWAQCRHRGHRARVLPADPRRPRLRSGVRLRARVHLAVRLGADDRRGRAMAALPDDRLGVDRDGGGLAAEAPHRARRGGRTGRLRDRGVVRLRHLDEPV
ncbi:MAG: Substrate-specific component CbrT of predicted cobalamin ECF transporter, partial [uncultured Nocardioides sp.]